MMYHKLSRYERAISLTEYYVSWVGNKSRLLIYYYQYVTNVIVRKLLFKIIMITILYKETKIRHNKQCRGLYITIWDIQVQYV